MVTKMRVLGQKLQGGTKRPPPACLGLNKNLKCFPSVMFPNLWNAIEIDLKESKSAKTFKQRVIILRIMRSLNTKNLVVYHVM